MDDPSPAYERMLRMLDAHGAEYRLYHHRPILTYEDARAVAAEAGFSGTEGKCVVLKVDDGFAVYTTIEGNRVDLGRVRDHLGAAKVRLASADELRDRFGAEPGSAYPFGFDAGVRIFVDPAVYEQEWILFSVALPTATAQVRGRDLPGVFRSLPNPTEEVTTFNR